MPTHPTTTTTTLVPAQTQPNPPLCRYAVGAKLPARLLYIDPVSKAVGLSGLTHLLNLRLPSPVPMMGQVCVRLCVSLCSLLSLRAVVVVWL
jgi:hypothetical protein